MSEKDHYKFGMESAHEKTRIRQLEDAAAHWEHKYANARQYNRNLEERCQQLEAALKIALTDMEEMNYEMYVPNLDNPPPSRGMIAAREALGTTSETKVDDPPGYGTTDPCPNCGCNTGRHMPGCPRSSLNRGGKP